MAASGDDEATGFERARDPRGGAEQCVVVGGTQ